MSSTAPDGAKQEPKPFAYELWRHLADEHGLTLLDSEIHEILKIAAPFVSQQPDAREGTDWVKKASREILSGRAPELLRYSWEIEAIIRKHAPAVAPSPAAQEGHATWGVFEDAISALIRRAHEYTLARDAQTTEEQEVAYIHQQRAADSLREVVRNLRSAPPAVGVDEELRAFEKNGWDLIYEGGDLDFGVYPVWQVWKSAKLQECRPLMLAYSYEGTRDAIRKALASHGGDKGGAK